MTRQALLQIGVQGGETPGEQILLGAEVVIERSGGDARLLADLPDG